MNTDERVTTTVKEADGLSATQIATALGLSKSPVAKALVRQETHGVLYRVAGGHDGTARLPDLWYHTNTHWNITQAETATAPADEAEPGAEGTGGGRLARGELRTLVLGFLEQNAGTEYGPSQLAKKLDRSAGAIANILDKAASERLVELTHIRPKRYRHKSR